MSLIYNGNVTDTVIYNGQPTTGVYNGVIVWGETQPTPPSLPPYTLRLRFRDGVTPTFAKGTAVQVSSNPNIWDLTYENTDWNNLLSGQSYLIEVIDGNTYDVTDMGGAFYNCYSLTNIFLFDTSNVTNMSKLFMFCDSLTSIPLFDTSKVTNMDNMFLSCLSVQTGALALYQQASTQTNPPSNHSMTFRDCGSGAPTGVAELAQIPSDWK